MASKSRKSITVSEDSDESSSSSSTVLSISSGSDVSGSGSYSGGATAAGSTSGRNSYIMTPTEADLPSLPTEKNEERSDKNLVAAISKPSQHITKTSRMPSMHAHKVATRTVVNPENTYSISTIFSSFLNLVYNAIGFLAHLFVSIFQKGRRGSTYSVRSEGLSKRSSGYWKERKSESPKIKALRKSLKETARGRDSRMSQNRDSASPIGERRQRGRKGDQKEMNATAEILVRDDNISWINSQDRTIVVKRDPTKFTVVEVKPSEEVLKPVTKRPPASTVKKEEKEPLGTTIYHQKASNIWVGCKQVTGAVKVLMDYTHKMAFVQIISADSQVCLTYCICNLIFVNTCSPDTVAWFGAVYDPLRSNGDSRMKSKIPPVSTETAEDDSKIPAEKERKRSKSTGKEPGTGENKSEIVQVMFRNPNQCQRLKTVVETLKSALDYNSVYAATCVPKLDYSNHNLLNTAETLSAQGDQPFSIDCYREPIKPQCQETFEYHQFCYNNPCSQRNEQIENQIFWAQQCHDAYAPFKIPGDIFCKNEYTLIKENLSGLTFPNPCTFRNDYMYDLQRETSRMRQHRCDLATAAQTTWGYQSNGIFNIRNQRCYPIQNQCINKTLFPCQKSSEFTQGQRLLPSQNTQYDMRIQGSELDNQNTYLPKSSLGSRKINPSLSSNHSLYSISNMNLDNMNEAEMSSKPSVTRDNSLTSARATMGSSMQPELSRATNGSSMQPQLSRFDQTQTVVDHSAQNDMCIDDSVVRNCVIIKPPCKWPPFHPRQFSRIRFCFESVQN